MRADLPVHGMVSSVVVHAAPGGGPPEIQHRPPLAPPQNLIRLHFCRSIIHPGRYGDVLRVATRQCSFPSDPMDLLHVF